MYIRLAQLAAMLQARVSIRAFNVAAQTIKQIEMFPVCYDPAKDVLDSNILYVCNYRQLRSYDPHLALPPLMCVLDPGTEEDSIFFADRTVLVAVGITVPELMLSLVETAYTIGNKSSPLAERSTEIIKCRSVDELMQAGLRILDNPLLLTDENQHILTSAGNDSTMAIYETIRSDGSLPLEPPMPEGGSDHSAETDYPFIVEETVVKGVVYPRVMTKRLRSAGKIVGYLHIFQFDRDFSSEDIDLVELLGNLLAQEIIKMPERRRNGSQSWAKEKFFRDILENDYDEKAVLERQKELDLKFHTYIYTVIVCCRAEALLAGVSIHDLTMQLASSLPNCTGLLFRSTAFLVLSTEHEIRDADYFAPIMPLMEKYDMAAGISNPFSSLERIKQYGYQSRKALQLGLGLKREESFYFFRDYSIYYMVELCLKSERITAFCLPEVIKLIQYDRKGSGELVKTLKTYLRCGGHKSQTAKELFVHLNTIKYRLQQINDIMGIDLDQNENALKILLSFKLLEYREAFPTYEPLNM